MMTEEEKYLFDLQGYLVLKGVLDAKTIADMHQDMETHGVTNPDNDPNKSRFGGFFEWGKNWRDLIDHPKLLPVLRGILGEKFRIDHAYGMAARVGGEEGHFGMHHEGGMFQHGCYYVTHGEQMHNGLIVVSYALSDTPTGGGGFCCIPGSHKSLYKTPKQYYRADDNPLLKHVPVKAGDVIVFTEALTHGTMRWTTAGHERRAVLLKYCPHYMQWAGGPMKSDIEGLTERQKLILKGPHVWQREAI
jgi:hypothetical protein